MTISEAAAPLRPPERNGWLNCSCKPGPSADHIFLQPSLHCPGLHEQLNQPLGHYFFPLFYKLTQSKQIPPDIYTYGILINYCTRVDRVGLAFVLLGRFLMFRSGADPDVLNPLLKDLCKNNRIPEAAAMVLDKMPKLGCAPDLFSYSTLMDGLCKIGQIEKAEELVDYSSEFVDTSAFPNIEMVK